MPQGMSVIRPLYLQYGIPKWLYDLSYRTKTLNLMIWCCENPELFTVALILLISVFILVVIFFLKKSILLSKKFWVIGTIFLLVVTIWFLMFTGNTNRQNDSGEITVSWNEAVRILNSGQVETVFRLSEKVVFYLKDGTAIGTKEAKIDNIFDEVKKCGDPCRDIRMWTD